MVPPAPIFFDKGPRSDTILEVTCALGYFPRGQKRPWSDLMNLQYALPGGLELAFM